MFNFRDHWRGLGLLKLYTGNAHPRALQIAGVWITLSLFARGTTCFAGLSCRSFCRQSGSTFLQNVAVQHALTMILISPLEPPSFLKRGANPVCQPVELSTGYPQELSTEAWKRDNLRGRKYALEYKCPN